MLWRRAGPRSAFLLTMKHDKQGKRRNGGYRYANSPDRSKLAGAALFIVGVDDLDDFDDLFGIIVLNGLNIICWLLLLLGRLR